MKEEMVVGSKVIVSSYVSSIEDDIDLWLCNTKVKNILSVTQVINPQTGCVVTTIFFEEDE